MMDEHTRFTEEALKSQDGKKVPLTLYPGGPVIGEATMKYDPGTKALEAQCQISDPELAKELRLKLDPPSVISRKDE
jgi:hypothetical protein